MKNFTRQDRYSRHNLEDQCFSIFSTSFNDLVYILITMREKIRFITVPPINQLFVTLWVKLYIDNLESLMLLPYGSGGKTIMSPSIKNRIKESYSSFKARSLGSETIEAMEDFFRLNIVRATLGNNQDGDLYNLQPFQLRYEKD